MRNTCHNGKHKPKAVEERHGNAELIIGRKLHAVTDAFTIINDM
jgi:hypothetical protein